MRTSSGSKFSQFFIISVIIIDVINTNTCSKYFVFFTTIVFDGVADVHSDFQVQR